MRTSCLKELVSRVAFRGSRATKAEGTDRDPRTIRGWRGEPATRHSDLGGSRSRWRLSFPFVLSLLAACDGDSMPSKLRIGLNPWPGYMDLTVAAQEGFFARNGIDIHIVEYTSLHDMARAYQLGQIDIMPCTLVEVLEVSQGHRPVEVIWIADASAGGDVVLAKGAKSVAELRGMKVAYEPNSLGLYVLARMLEKSGLAMTDIEPIGMDQTEMVDSMRSGSIGAAITYPPASLAIREIEGVHTVFTTAEIPNEVLDVLSMDPSFLDADPTLLPRFYVAMAETEEFARSNPEAAIAQKCKKMGLDRSSWESAVVGIEMYRLADQREWIWGSNRIQDLLQKMTAVVSATYGPRRLPGSEVTARHRPLPACIGLQSAR